MYPFKRQDLLSGSRRLSAPAQSKRLSFLFFFYPHLFTSEGPQCSQRTTYGCHFSSSTVRVPGIELRVVSVGGEPCNALSHLTGPTKQVFITGGGAGGCSQVWTDGPDRLLELFKLLTLRKELNYRSSICWAPQDHAARLGLALPAATTTTKWS